MEFGFTPEQENLRKEVRDFFFSELPEDFEPHVPARSEALQSFLMQVQRKAGEKGYLTPGWSKESGGMELGPIEQTIVQEEWGYAGVMWPNMIGLGLAGPAVHLFGTDEQKQRFLPPISQGKVVWYQSFTEPNAGSDESNIQMRAVPDGDYWVLNGQKTFIGEAYKPDFLYTLARTANTVPKHRGISLFLVPADLPGITYRPLPVLGDSYKNEIFYEDVRVNKEYMLGEMNKGFYYAMSTFEFERGGAHRITMVKRELDEFIEFCKHQKRNGKPLIEDPQVRMVVARRAVELEMVRLVTWYSAWWMSKRKQLGRQPPTPNIRLYPKTCAVRWAKELMDILGP